MTELDEAKFALAAVGDQALGIGSNAHDLRRGHVGSLIHPSTAGAVRPCTLQGHSVVIARWQGAGLALRTTRRPCGPIVDDRHRAVFIPPLASGQKELFAVESDHLGNDVAGRWQLLAALRRDGQRGH